MKNVTPTPTPYKRATPTPTPKNTEKTVKVNDNKLIVNVHTTDGTVLPGCSVTLTTVTKGIDLTKIVKSSKSGGKSFDFKKNQISFKNTNEDTILTQLPDGTYRLHENLVPAGYEMAYDIWFKVADGKICDMDGKVIKNSTVILVNPKLAGNGREDDHNNPEYPEEQKTTNKVKSPQTEDSLTKMDNFVLILGTSIIAVLMLMVIVLLIKDRKRAKRQ